MSLLALSCNRAAERQGAPPASGDSLLAAGESLFVHEKYDSARAVWRLSLERARASRNEDVQAQALTSIGFAAYRLGDADEARTHAEQALELERRRAPTRNLARTYNVLGLLSRDDGRFTDASAWLEKAIEAARATNDSDVLVRATGNLGLMAANLGDMKGARDAHRAQRTLARALGNAQLEGNSYTNEASVDIWEGNPRPAIARLDTARGLYLRANYGTGRQYALMQLSTAYEETGDVDAAFAVLDTALALARELQLKSQEAEALRLLAGLHARVGDYRRAIDYYEQAESRMRALGYEVQRPSGLRGAAEAYLRLANLPRARANAEEALRLDVASDEKLDRLDDLLLLAEIDFRESGLARAEPRLRAGLALADQLGTRGSRLAVALAEAHLADQAQNPRRVLRALRGAGPDIAAGDFAAEWESNALAARAHARLNELDSAVVAGRRAVSAVERLRGALVSAALRSTFVADRAEVYSDLAVALLRLGRAEEAFGIADAARSGELMRRLGATREDARAGALPRELLESEDLLRRIDDLVQRLRESERGRRRERGEALDSADAALAAQLDRTRGEYEALTIRLAQRRPRALAVLGNESAHLETVRAALGAGEALLDYLVTADRVIVFVVTREGLKIVQTDIAAAALTQRVRLLHDLWGSPLTDWRWGLGAARALHGALVAPVVASGALNGVRQLVIVPHGILGQVPFAALVDEKTSRYLVQDYLVTVLPSAAALATVRGERTAPTFADGRGVGLAPFPEELPATRQEVEAFRGLLPHATLELQGRATERALRRALALGAPVHVATHAVLNVRNPMFSRIELARPSAVRADDDGRLEVHELLGLTIRSPLVFLSGCETGAGREWTDEAVRGTAELTLAQAFLSAGAGNVILTLWRIDDAGAGEFAKRFYAELARSSVSGALARAQRGMAEDARYANPYYWAAYLLSGAGPVESSPQDGGDSSVSLVSGSSARQMTKPRRVTDPTRY